MHAKNAFSFREQFPAIGDDAIYRGFPFSFALSPSPRLFRIVGLRGKLAQRACNYHQPSEVARREWQN